MSVPWMLNLCAPMFQILLYRISSPHLYWTKSNDGSHLTSLISITINRAGSLAKRKSFSILCWQSDLLFHWFSKDHKSFQLIDKNICFNLLRPEKCVEISTFSFSLFKQVSTLYNWQISIYILKYMFLLAPKVVSLNPHSPQRKLGNKITVSGSENGCS